MGMVRAVQKGELDPSDAPKSVVEAAKDMKKSDVKDFAETKHKGLPEEVKTAKLMKKNIVSETYKFFRRNKKTHDQSRILAAEARETGNFPNEVLKIMKENSDAWAAIKKNKAVAKAPKVKKVAPKPDVPEGTQLELFKKLGYKKKKKKLKYPAPPEGDSRGQNKKAGLQDSQKSLKKWTKQEWTTPSGKKSSETGEVYLPKKKIERLKSTEKGRKRLARANRIKRKGSKKGKQFTRHGEASGQGYKQAGLLDNIKDNLAEGIWFESPGGYTLRPAVKNYIISTLRKILPLELVDKIFIIGSITGYKYKDTSDVDVNVYLKQEVTKEDVKLYHVKARSFNEQNAPGTEHPVNFYISDFKKTEPFKWAKFGVYSVLDDLWINTPTPKTELIEPDVEFHKELNTARIFSRNFARLVDEYAKDLVDYKALLSDPDSERKLESKQKELDLDLKRLMDEEKRLHDNREFVYSKGWGVPRKSFRNLLYKLIEHNQYGNVLSQLKSYRHREK